MEQMDPLTRGALFHSAQFELFRALASAKLLPVTQNELPAALDLADQVLDRVAAQYEDDLAPAIPRVWKSEIENLRTDLRGWLQQVAASHSDWMPVHFEFGFGLAPDPNRDPASTSQEAVILDGIRLRGSIDLIERHATSDALRVTDHKTGKSPKDRPQYVGGGAILQPLLYALAAETLLGQSVVIRPALFLYPARRFLFHRYPAQRRIAPAPPPRARNHRPIHRRGLSAGRSANRRLRAMRLLARSAAPTKKRA